MLHRPWADVRSLPPTCSSLRQPFCGFRPRRTIAWSQHGRTSTALPSIYWLAVVLNAAGRDLLVLCYFQPHSIKLTTHYFHREWMNDIERLIAEHHDVSRRITSYFYVTTATKIQDMLLLYCILLRQCLPNKTAIITHDHRAERASAK